MSEYNEVLKEFLNTIKEEIYMDEKENKDVTGCCEDYENCNAMCIPRTEYWKQRYEELNLYNKNKNDIKNMLKGIMDNKNLSNAINLLINELKNDDQYAWSWVCNIAMAFYDEGGDSKLANDAAIRFLSTFCNKDLSYLQQKYLSNDK